MIPTPELDSYINSCGIEIVDVSRTYFFKANISEVLTKKLIAQTDKILEDANSIDYSPNLAGEIYDGKQILIDSSYYKEESIAELLSNLESASGAYISRFLKKANTTSVDTSKLKFKCQMNDMWIVSQEAHDYNPPHRHSTASPVGLSGVLYLKVPPQISEENKDGYFHFTFGPTCAPDMRTLKLADQLDILPTTSTMLLFPKDTCHEVFPFRGDGERRCIAFNVNVFPENFDTK